MDLTQYGIRVLLTPNTDINAISASNIEQGAIQENEDGEIDSFRLEDTIYTVHRFLGSGTYGSLYEVIGPDQQRYALKLFAEDLAQILKESIVHILLADASKYEENGPYVPILYRIAYNSFEQCAFILTELMEETLQDLIMSNDEATNDLILPDAILQISKILIFFGKTLQFNHRDLKPDNIMYTTKGGITQYRLIDFGLSCLTWKNLQIRTKGPFRTCFSKNRDMSQFLYGVYSTFKYFLSKRLMERIYRMLLANIGPYHTKCALTKGCEHEGLRNWQSSYEFFNRSNLQVPSATMYTAKKHMENFLQEKEFVPTPNFQEFQASVNSLARNVTEKNHVPITPLFTKNKTLFRNTRKLNKRLITKKNRTSRK